jgi:hypothetical protein
MRIINVSSLCTSKGQSLFVAPDHTTEQWFRCDKTRACRTCLVDSAVKNAEQHFYYGQTCNVDAGSREAGAGSKINITCNME